MAQRFGATYGVLTASTFFRLRALELAMTEASLNSALERQGTPYEQERFLPCHLERPT